MVNTKINIANGQSLSSAAYFGGKRLARIIIPATWTAASLSFQHSVNGVTFNDLYDESGNEITVSAVAGKAMSISSNVIGLCDLNYLKVRSGTTGTPVAQGGARVLGIEMA